MFYGNKSLFSVVIERNTTNNVKEYVEFLILICGIHCYHRTLKGLPPVQFSHKTALITDHHPTFNLKFQVYSPLLRRMKEGELLLKGLFIVLQETDFHVCGERFLSA
jgi:hypothetical protein